MDDKTQLLYDRLDKNLSDYHDAIVRLEPRDIIEMADRISVYSDAYAYLTNHHDFEASEVDYLLSFQNPLEVVADEWQRRREDISDMSFALDTVFNKQDALQGGYALMSDTPERQSEGNQAQRPSPDTESRHEEASDVTEKKPSILGQLQAAREAPASEKQIKPPGVSKDVLR